MDLSFKMCHFVFVPVQHSKISVQPHCSFVFYSTCIVIIYNHKAVSAVDSLVQGVLFLVSAGLYLIGRQEYLGFLVLCLALSWVNLLYYSRGDIHMGIYSIMIQKVGHTGRTAPQ